MATRGSHSVDLIEVIDRPEWQYESLCYIEGVDPEVFYPSKEKTSGQMRDQYDEARSKYCDRCHTREQCLQYALDKKIPEGMFGGATPRQRRTMLRANTGLVSIDSTPQTHHTKQGRDANGQFVSGNKEQSWDTRKSRGSKRNQYK